MIDKGTGTYLKQPNFRSNTRYLTRPICLRIRAHLGEELVVLVDELDKVDVSRPSLLLRLVNLGGQLTIFLPHSRPTIIRGTLRHYNIWKVGTYLNGVICRCRHLTYRGTVHTVTYA